MNTVSIADFRQNMSSFLENVKMKQKPMVLGKRNKPEFLVIPILSEEDREMYNSTGFWKRLEEARADYNKNGGYTLEEVKKHLGL